MHPNLKKLAIGTAQFGQSYGIANTLGMVSPADVGIILSTARSHGIKTLDTAISYGSSEKVLGSQGVDGFLVITKLPSVPQNTDQIENWIDMCVANSLAKLNLSSIGGILLHHPMDLLGPSGSIIYRKLMEMKSSGVVQKLGISIYNPQELELILGHFSFDILQTPLSIFDRRILGADWLDRLKSCNVELHVRSVFLQGLLLLSRETRPSKFSPWQKLWEAWDVWLEKTEQSALSACLNYPLSIPEVSRVIVGVDSPLQFRQIIASVGGDYSEPSDNLQCLDEDLLHPSIWGSL